ECTMIRHHVKATLAAYVTLSASLLLLGFLWLFRLGAPLHAQSQPEALGSLSGTVRNEEGEPLPNIAVRLSQYQGQYASRQTTTDAQGAYEFLSILSGLYVLQFQDSQNVYAPALYENAHFSEDAKTVAVNGNAVTGIDMRLALGGAISVKL